MNISEPKLITRLRTYVNTASTVSSATGTTILDACSDGLAILGVGNLDLFAAVGSALVLVVVDSDDVVRVLGVFAAVACVTIFF